MTEENVGRREWGLGLGFVLGIVLAILSLSNLPWLMGRGLFFQNAANRPSDGRDDQLGERSSLPHRQSLPARQNFEDLVLEGKPGPQSSDGPTTPATVSPAAVSSPANSEARLIVIPAQPSTADATTAQRFSGGVTQKLFSRLSPPAATDPSRTDSAAESPVAESPAALLKQARFLIKAGLAPMATDPLRKVVQEAPGSPIAQEAQQTLDSLSRN